MWNPFKHYSEIDVRLKEFFVWKTETVGISIALHYKEAVVKFIMISHVDSPNDLVIEHVHDFKSWVLDHYCSDYLIEKQMKAIRSFLRFCQRYDIIFEMNKLGRKPDYMAIAVTKELVVKKKLTYRDVVKEFAKRGRRIDVKQVHRWIHAK